MNLYQYFYISRSKLTSGTDIQHIVHASRSRNATLAITGALVYSGDHFAQVLEGIPEALAPLMSAIRHDARHTILWEWPIQPTVERWYPEWSMGYLQNDILEAVVEHLSRAPPPLPPLAYFVQWLISTSRLNKRSPTPPQRQT